MGKLTKTVDIFLIVYCILAMTFALALVVGYS